MIVVTGAAGFIGSNLAHRLAGMGCRDLLLVDRSLTRAKAANLTGLLDFRFSGHKQFLTDLQGGKVKAQVIFHLGACSDTTMGDWDFLRENNLEYTQALWEWCAGAGIPFIYASSAATYGDGSLGFDDATAPEELTPLNLYGKSKNDFDRWALGRVAAGAPVPRGWAGLKFFNVYGPREMHKGRMASVVFHAYNQILATGKMRLFQADQPGKGDGEQQRDFVYVGDCVEHMLWFRDHPEVCGVFNSGTGAARSFNDLVRATFAAMEREAVIEYFPMPADLHGKYQSYTRAEMGKLQRVGYPAEPTSLEVGAKRYVEWLLGVEKQ